MSWPEFGYSLTAAEEYLALHDSVAALWPRMMLLRADLAAAADQKAEARVWDARVLDLWADADAELQPTVARSTPGRRDWRNGQATPRRRVGVGRSGGSGAEPSSGRLIPNLE